MQILSSIFKRELLLVSRNKGQWLSSSFFFIMISSIFPMIFSQDLNILIKIAGPIILILALLAILFSFDNLFKNDYNLGIFYDYMLSNYSLSWLILGKIITHIILISLPLLSTMPVILFFYNIEYKQGAYLIMSLILSIPALSFIAAINSALLVSLPRNNLLLVILSLPIFIPVLLFSVTIPIYVEQDLPISGIIALLVASNIILLLISPFICTFSLKAGMQCGN